MKIKYWLVRRACLAAPTIGVYYSHTGETANPKHAARYFDRESAEQAARWLGDRWEAYEWEVDGSEPAWK